MTEKDEASLDMMLTGTGVMKNGKRIDPSDFYAKPEWGDDIVINGVRPAWLLDQDQLNIAASTSGPYLYRNVYKAFCITSWPKIIAIRLRPDHPRYATPEMTMVEKVARAICIALGDDPDREEGRLTAYDDAARAAIAATRP